MIETSSKPLISRIADIAFGRSQNLALNAQTNAVPNTLVWLAGAGYNPRQTTTALRPTPRKEREAADVLLRAVRPPNPVEAAAQRASLLKKLRKFARSDPRVMAIFDSDPVLVEDLHSGVIVTESLFHARLKLFDTLDQMFEDERVAAMEHKALRFALIDAFPCLSNQARREWALSAVRFEQFRAFVEAYEPQDLAELLTTLVPVYKTRGAWETMRLLTHASALAQPEPLRFQPVTALLQSTRTSESN